MRSAPSIVVIATNLAGALEHLTLLIGSIGDLVRLRKSLKVVERG